MGHWLRDSGWLPDFWISSDARRAKDTAFAMMHAAGQSHLNLTLDPALYHASQEMLMAQMGGLPPASERVLLVGHNPGLTYLNRSLGFKSLDNLPTCGLVIWQATDWAGLASGKARYVMHQFPRMLNLEE
jgi:phosphohistidine phosphatase